MNFSHPWQAALICLMVASGGCQPGPTRPIGTAHGRVTANGQPLNSGTIVFEHTETDGAVTGSINADGRYQLQTYRESGLPIGQYRVIVMPRIAGELGVVGSEPKSAPPGNVIPVRYQQRQTSPLTATIAEGANPPFDFDLKH